MTKADLINEVSKKTGIEKVVVKEAIETFMDIIKESLINKENVYLRKFGSFVIKKRAEKTARNISKNEKIVIPAHYIPAFKPSKLFLDEVKEKVK